MLSKYPELHGHAVDDSVRKLFVGHEPQFVLVIVQVAHVWSQTYESHKNEFHTNTGGSIVVKIF